ncbi:MAG: hypothetical protein HY538_01380 [Deltaproteobacteria bacterium]|nr:hypothetical protein [Deltaproteobacteria bacterium]
MRPEALSRFPNTPTPGGKGEYGSDLEPSASLLCKANSGTVRIESFTPNPVHFSEFANIA